MAELIQPAITIQNISKFYGKKPVLSNVSLTVKQGEIFGLLGPSGCGKTTTVKIMSGILKADRGWVKVLGTRMPAFSCMSKIGYMAQSAALYPTLTGYENLKFFGSLYHMKGKDLKKRIDEVTALVGLSDEMKKLVSAYSGGMKQRLSLAITLLADPSVLILDEPTVGIDPVLRQKIWGALIQLRNQGVSIVVTTHVMDEAVHCNRLAMMQEGRLLICGNPDAMINASGCKDIENAFIYYSTKQGRVAI